MNQIKLGQFGTPGSSFQPNNGQAGENKKEKEKEKRTTWRLFY
jgi:hypothetical protein